ncbi:hypothetical protein [Pseudomonas sp. Sample_24]|jgi:hypothetical protein|uniref:hypothetical protein n=1 Tax=Pseudomonas sp. Sample_24 TaxID=2448268 RepID=UPI001032A519|nr:hypothetical protein [Pseudomonas sp. Sample_24]
MDYMFLNFRQGRSENLALEVKEYVGLTEKTVPETTHYTGLTVNPVEDILDDACDSYRAEWYSLISHSSFSPKFVDAKLVFFADPEKEKNACISNSVYKRLEHAVYCRLKKFEEEESAKQEEKLLSSLSEFCRYLPDLDRPDANFFVDEKTGGVGVTIKKSGTLSLLVHAPGSVDFSYASKGRFGGLVRITGTAKLTKNIENSEHIKSLLEFLGGK